MTRTKLEDFEHRSWSLEQLELHVYSRGIWSIVAEAVQLNYHFAQMLPPSCSTNALQGKRNGVQSQAEEYPENTQYQVLAYIHITPGRLTLNQLNSLLTSSSSSSRPNSLLNIWCISCLTPHAYFSSKNKLLLRNIVNSFKWFSIISIFPRDM